MTVGFSSANIATPLLNAVARATNWTAPVANYAKLYVGDPGATGAANAAAGSTTRVVMTWAAPSGNAVALAATFPVWTNGGTTETLTHIGVFDAIAAGNFLYSIVLTSSQPWVLGNTFTLTSASITASPIAA